MQRQNSKTRQSDSEIQDNIRITETREENNQGDEEEYSYFGELSCLFWGRNILDRG